MAQAKYYSRKIDLEIYDNLGKHKDTNLKLTNYIMIVIIVFVIIVFGNISPKLGGIKKLKKESIFYKQK